MNHPALATDSLVAFRNSQLVEARGTLLRLSRSSAVFEVYNPYSIVQLSEVITDLRICRGDRTIYSGRAVVSNLVSTGLVLIVSVTLIDPWSNLIDLAPGPELRGEVREFVEDWESSQRNLRPTYELAVSKLRNFLDELSLWLEEGEAVVGVREPHASEDVATEFVADVEHVVGSKLDELIGYLEQEARQISGDELTSHKAFAQRELHPFMLCSPFMHRAYTKPLGYAGDYEMVNMILRNRWEGSNAYAKVINSAFLRSDVAQAHRNRIDWLTQCLNAEARRIAKEGRVFRVANIGCGPAEEVRRFVSDPSTPGASEFRLIDFNEETLSYIMAQINTSVLKETQNTRVEFVHQSIHDLLKKASQRQTCVEPSYDIVYCAGLFDYLSDRICRRLIDLFFDWVLPGGLVVTTNVHTRNPNRRSLEHVAEWYLVHRDESDMLALASRYSQRRVVTEETGTNIFLEVRKPATPGRRS